MNAHIPKSFNKSLIEFWIQAAPLVVLSAVVIALAINYIW
jgi:hypothetical protein